MQIGHKQYPGDRGNLSLPVPDGTVQWQENTFILLLVLHYDDLYNYVIKYYSVKNHINNI